MEGNRKKVYISTYLLVLLLKQIKLMKTKAHNDVIYSFKILFDVCNFNSLFSYQVSCQDLPTNKKKQTGHCHPDYKGKRCEIRE